MTTEYKIVSLLQWLVLCELDRLKDKTLFYVCMTVFLEEIRIEIRRLSKDGQVASVFDIDWSIVISHRTERQRREKSSVCLNQNMSTLQLNHLLALTHTLHWNSAWVLRYWALKVTPVSCLWIQDELYHLVFQTS